MITRRTRTATTGPPTRSSSARSVATCTRSRRADLDDWSGFALPPLPLRRPISSRHRRPAASTTARSTDRASPDGSSPASTPACSVGPVARSWSEPSRRGPPPTPPTCIAATPTLEMGIDIGDLSSVMLTSVPRNPASYIQRVGRAGRATGNSLITTFVRTDTHGLYYLADPEAMIAGDVRPPDCFLDAVETLQRQYVAFLLDRIADQTRRRARSCPTRSASSCAPGWTRVATCGPPSTRRSSIPTHVDRFLALFGDRLAAPTVEHLRVFAGAEIEAAVKEAVERWQRELRELENRRTRLAGAIDRLEDQGRARSRRGGRAPEPARPAAGRHRPAPADTEASTRCRPSSVSASCPTTRWPTTPSPSSATMWSQTDDGYETDLVEYKRSARRAITEFAPANSFYAGGHRHHIDALEIGSAQEPLYETWRLCPDCGFGTIELEGDPPTVCPRCAGQGIADTGRRYTLLRMRTALANGSEERRPGLRRERRTPTGALRNGPHRRRRTRARSSGAWTLTDRAFGAEFAGVTHLRTINLGFSNRPGERRTVAGRALPTSPASPSAPTVVRCTEARDDRERHQARAAAPGLVQGPLRRGRRPMGPDRAPPPADHRSDPPAGPRVDVRGGGAAGLVQGSAAPRAPRGLRRRSRPPRGGPLRRTQRPGSGSSSVPRAVRRDPGRHRLPRPDGRPRPDEDHPRASALR